MEKVWQDRTRLLFRLTERRLRNFTYWNRPASAGYLLVADCAEGDGEAMILKDLSGDGETEGLFAVVEDDEELAAVAGVFESMLEDVELVEE